MDGCIRSLKITICHFKHNTTNRPVDIIIARDSASPFCPVQAMLDYCKVRRFSPGPLSTYTTAPSPLTNSMLNFALAYLFVLLIQADTKATAFGSGPPVTRLT